MWCASVAPTPRSPTTTPLASEDDGSCSDVSGCTDESADNYNPDATADDSSCVITGCTDPTALNYNANTTLEDNSTCYYTLPSIIINEIHYNPCNNQGDDFDYEFVELLNIGRFGRGPLWLRILQLHRAATTNSV